MTPGEVMDWLFVACMVLLVVAAGVCFYKFIRE